MGIVSFPHCSVGSPAVGWWPLTCSSGASLLYTTLVPPLGLPLFVPNHRLAPENRLLDRRKGLVTLRDYGFFLSENHVIEEIFKFFFCQYLLFWVILKNPQSDFQIFTFLKCKDDLTGLFTSQPIAVVALSTASAAPPGATEMSIISFQIKYSGSCGELCWGW